MSLPFLLLSHYQSARALCSLLQANYKRKFVLKKHFLQIEAASCKICIQKEKKRASGASWVVQKWMKNSTDFSDLRGDREFVNFFFSNL